MDCCNYGEYRAHGQYASSVAGVGGVAGWEYNGYTHGYYSPYAHGYYAPHAHDPYGRYYRYDYPAHHVPHNDHVMSMDYGAYASKEARVRRALARRDARAHTPVQHLPLLSTPPLECGMNGRGASYCEPQMWSHYQMSVLGGGWNSANTNAWSSRNACPREHMRYPIDCRPTKGHHQSQVCPPDGRSTPYPTYEDAPFRGENGIRQRTAEFQTASSSESMRSNHEPFLAESRVTPPQEKRPPIVPLPAFQQAFGSTEIGKFAEAFSRAEVALEDISNENFAYESFPEWEGPSEPQWSSQPAAREIKCEDNY